MSKLVSGKLTSKGQLTIPVELRNSLNLEEGDRLEFELDEEGNISSIKPRKKRPLKDVIGILRDETDPRLQLDLSEENKAVKKHVLENYIRSMENQ
ncbi:AbrB/MazE/SpoVT family DNA-binding domain-containing protein [Paenibacillus koleovorans]|uniref:AbrB/MazE/SpoVT family DNA-binding domain-containing protein n=1 Tax=Paenibacillus koleovorans TaxID=121608 RepID=UPI000FDAFE9B|nr:AbrB/MazE/SpoVT family DNA-binding domain-containing protein [Paenibacillus koleovorans]